MEQGKSPIDREAIKAMTGYSDKELDEIIKNWSRGEQDMSEVEKGVLWERENRLAAADRPGGLVDQIRVKTK